MCEVFMCLENIFTVKPGQVHPPKIPLMNLFFESWIHYKLYISYLSLHSCMCNEVVSNVYQLSFLKFDVIVSKQFYP